MSIKRTQFEQNKKLLCKNCTLFYSAEAYQGLCSACHKKKKNQMKQELAVNTIQTDKISVPISKQNQVSKIKQEVQQQVQKDKNRCYECRKKVGLLGISCKCGFIYCNGHRLPEDHKCNFNHAEIGKKQLEKQITKVYNGKISQI